MKLFIEQACVVIILAFFLILQINAISKGNYAGQDFERHCANIRESAQNPGQALVTPFGNGRSPATLYHWIGGRLYNIVGEPSIWPLLALLNLTANTAALLLFYLLIRRVVSLLLVRLSCFIFITFLPLMVITSMVIAPDAFTALIFAAILWTLIVIVERLKTKKPAFGREVCAGSLLVAAFLIKFIYGFCLIATVLAGLILWRCGVLDKKQLWSAFVTIILIPLAICVLCFFLFVRYQENVDLFAGNEVPDRSHMSMQSIFFFKANDRALLGAPFFHQVFVVKGEGAFRPFHVDDFFSYPAMLHLAVFTDFLNIDQPILYPSHMKGMVDEYYTRVRTLENQKRMRLAVHSGLLFFLAMIVAVAGLLLTTIRWFLARTAPDIPVMILLVLSLTLFLGMSFGLPFIMWPCLNGVWLPRHIMPAIISFAVCLFVVLDRTVVHKAPWAQGVICAMVIAQSALHFSFLWVTPVTFRLIGALPLHG